MSVKATEKEWIEWATANRVSAEALEYRKTQVFLMDELHVAGEDDLKIKNSISKLIYERSLRKI